MRLELSPEKWRPFCPGGDELSNCISFDDQAVRHPYRYQVLLLVLLHIIMIIQQKFSFTNLTMPYSHIMIIS